MRSDTFPYPDRLAPGVSPLGPICYFEAGTETDTPPIVLIHALGTDMTQWEYVAPALAQHTRVIGLDLPGCGHSAKPRHHYRMEEMSAAVLGLLDHLSIERAVIMGHSYGGGVAAQVALAHPSRVAGLVLMNSSGFTRYSAPVRALARVLVRPVVLAPLIKLAVQRVLSHIFAVHNERTERFINRVLAHPDPRYAWDFAHYACPMLGDMMIDVLDRLDQLNLPVLVIWGEQDRLVRYRDVPAWVQRLPQGRLLSLPECGHMPNLEDPEAVNAAVLRFLQGLTGHKAKKEPLAQEGLG